MLVTKRIDHQCVPRCACDKVLLGSSVAEANRHGLRETSQLLNKTYFETKLEAGIHFKLLCAYLVTPLSLIALWGWRWWVCWACKFLFNWCFSAPPIQRVIRNCIQILWRFLPGFLRHTFGICYVSHPNLSFVND